MRQGSDYVLSYESQAAAGFDERNTTKIDPVVKRARGDAQTSRKLVDVDEIVIRHKEILLRR
jgi:hypothetical protein